MADNIEVTKAVRHVFTRQEKVGYAVVVATGSLAVVMGMFYMGTHLNAPFKITYTGNHFLTADQQQQAQITAQKKLDTDADGINDYDELNVYGTSPYLSDSDGDGIEDGTEINAGTDPLCAEGKVCSNTANKVTLTTPDVGAAPVAPTNVDPVAALKANLLAATTDEIKAMLLQSGATQAQIDAMTADQLKQAYIGVVDQLESSGELAKIVASAGGTATTDTTQPTP